MAASRSRSERTDLKSHPKIRFNSSALFAMRHLTQKITVIIVAVVLFSACTAEQPSGPVFQIETSADAININTSGVDELRRIPNIGEKLALKIVEFREKHGPFRRPEHLLLINGISDRRFREIRHLVRVE
jgi:competence ComEA-like helix-hairpin-helix protein